jgi:hypothetical protein
MTVAGPLMVFKEIGQCLPVHPLARQATADDVIGRGHDLHRDAGQVGVRNPGRHVYRLTGLKPVQPQQQRRHHQRIVGGAVRPG